MNYHRTVEKLPEPEMASALAQPPTGKFCQESKLNFPAEQMYISPFDQNM